MIVLVMGYTADFMPHVGQIPDKPGQFIIAGFNGHGMPQILLSSKGLAAMVQDGVAFEETELPRLFKTSKARIERQDNPMEEGLQPLWTEDHAKAKL
jgi:glycine/D-amino acid oxidase-like deaminating enzyme